MAELVVVGHQPQYLPYLGILHKISQADIFIIVDHVQYVRKSFHNRTYIKVAGQQQLLSIPVLSKGKYEAAIAEMQINNNQGWQRKHLKSLRLAYARAPFFEQFYADIEGIYDKNHEYLAAFTSELLIYFIRTFGLVDDIRVSSQLGIEGKKTDLLVELTRAVEGDVYLSGAGAKDYFDEQVFRRSGFEHRFSNFVHPQYPQLGKGFLEGMGCVDLLFNCGADGRKYIVNPEAYA
jgi:hypothetical protein